MAAKKKKQKQMQRALQDVVRALHRSLAQAEESIGGDESVKYGISHFEIDFPAQLGVGPDESGKTKEHVALVHLPETVELEDNKKGTLLKRSVPDQHLARVKLVLRRQHDVLPAEGNE